MPAQIAETFRYLTLADECVVHVERLHPLVFA
jgi:hypothetical protein